MAELIKIHPETPQPAKIRQIVECLRDGGIIIYPTDTVYGIGCDLHNPRAIEKICRIKHVDPKKMHLSFICYDLSNLSHYAKNVSNTAFKVMKRALPGGFTFILESSNEVPKIVGQKKKQVGIRIPDHAIPRAIVHELGNPIVTTSISFKGEDMDEYYTDPEEIFANFKHLVDMVIDGGMGGNVPSTVINCMDENFEVYRHGAGDITQIVELA